MTACAAGSSVYQCARLRVRLTAAGLVCAASAATAGEMPAPGIHAGHMCVHPIAGVPDAKGCGAVEIWLLRNDLAVVRYSDIAYRIALFPDALDIILMHGAMQIDGFVTPLYRWHGTELHFDDREKGMRYRIEFAPAAGPR